MVMKTGLLTLAMALLLGGCSFVKLSEEGEKVRVLSAAEVDQCKEVGKTVVNTLDRLVGLPRHEKSMQDELNRLARNSAVEIDGDTVVPITPIEDGKQTFAVYRCMPR